jgi:hypothetical protein
MKTILTEKDITRIVNKVLKEEPLSSDTPVSIAETSNISEIKVCVGKNEKMKCTNHKVVACLKGVCTKVKIKYAYISDWWGDTIELVAEIKPSDDSGFFIKNSFKTLLYPWLKGDGFLKVVSGQESIKKPLSNMISGNYPINVDIGYGVLITIK